MCLLAGQGGVIGALLCTSDLLHPRRTLYHAEHPSFSQFQPWMLITLTRTQLVLLSISNLLGAVLCLPRLCLPQWLEPPAEPPAKPAPKAAKPSAKPSTKSAAKPAAQVAAALQGEIIRQKKWHTKPVSEHASQQAVPGSFCGSHALVSA